MSKISNVVNIGKLLRDETKKNNTQWSPKAVEEYMCRVIDEIGINAPGIMEIAGSHGRKTVYEEDVVEFFSFVDTGTTRKDLSKNRLLSRIVKHLIGLAKDDGRLHAPTLKKIEEILF